MQTAVSRLGRRPPRGLCSAARAPGHLQGGPPSLPVCGCHSSSHGRIKGGTWSPCSWQTHRPPPTAMPTAGSPLPGLWPEDTREDRSLTGPCGHTRAECLVGTHLGERLCHRQSEKGSPDRTIRHVRPETCQICNHTHGNMCFLSADTGHLTPALRMQRQEIPSSSVCTAGHTQARDRQKWKTKAAKQKPFATSSLQSLDAHCCDRTQARAFAHL